jgi:SAM-dependent methyltransferase
VTGADALDLSKPGIARVYDALLGGKDNFAADQALADKLGQLYPPLASVVQENRQWLARVTTWAARGGITQFADLGCGFPGSPAVHEMARDAHPAARVVYVDNDPLATLHIRTLLADGRTLAGIEADLTAPAAVLGHPGLRAVIDPREPVCALLGLVLHFQDADAARAVTAGYARLLAPGSVLAVSVIRNDDPGLLQQIRAAYTPAALHNHSREDIAAFLSGLELVPPGVVLAHGWRGGWLQPGPLRPPGPAYVLAAVARKR